MTRFNLSVVAMVRDEAKILTEWIEFHRLVGVEHFYLYDNESTDNSREVLEHYVQEGIVTLNTFCCKWSGQTDNWFPKSLAPFNQAIANYRGETKWMAMIDADEFLVPFTLCENIPDVLARFDDTAALVVPWKTFSHAFHLRPPEALVIDSYLFTHDGTMAESCKSFVQPAKLWEMRGDDSVFFESAHIPVPRFRPQFEDGTEANLQKAGTGMIARYFHMAIFHYRLQSLEFFVSNKMCRPFSGTAYKFLYNTSVWFRQCGPKWNARLDTTASDRFGPSLRKILNKPQPPDEGGLSKEILKVDDGAEGTVPASQVINNWCASGFPEEAIEILHDSMTVDERLGKLLSRYAEE